MWDQEREALAIKAQKKEVQAMEALKKEVQEKKREQVAQGKDRLDLGKMEQLVGEVKGV